MVISSLPRDGVKPSGNPRKKKRTRSGERGRRMLRCATSAKELRLYGKYMEYTCGSFITSGINVSPFFGNSFEGEQVKGTMRGRLQSSLFFIQKRVGDEEN